jgi:hypothetical protein
MIAALKQVEAGGRLKMRRRSMEYRSTPSMPGRRSTVAWT